MKFVSMPHYQMRKNAIKKLLKGSGCRPGEKILEIGYGAGEVFTLYNELGLYVEGYDFSEDAYEYASKNSLGNNVVLLKEKPSQGRQYDYVIASEVLEHIENDVEQLMEWRTFLKDGGKMIISVPAHQKRWGDIDVWAGHYRRYEKSELKKKFHKAGMKIEKIYTYDFPVCVLLDRLRNRSYGQKIRKGSLERNKEELTKASGLERDFGPIVRALSHPALWFLIIKFEELFYRTDWGSGYILIAVKSMASSKK